MRTQDQNMTIDAKIENLYDIFAYRNNFYQVPNYQRPYSWDSENLSELLDDLATAYATNDGENYFCGSLVLAKNAPDDRFDIIDGQQRITTFTIIFCVLRDVYRLELGEKSTNYVNESIHDRHNASQKKLRLLTSEKSQSDFQTTVLDKLDFDNTKRNANKYIQNAFFVKEFMKEIFVDRGIKIDQFVEWMFEKVVLTVIICPSEDSAIQIFNVLNTRGMPLSPIDILKSSLMQKLSKGEERTTFQAKWNDIDSNLKFAKFNFDDVLNAYLYCKISSNPKSRLDKELLKVFKEKNINSIYAVQEISNFADVYIKAVKEDDKNLYCLRYLRHKIYWSSILSTALFVDYPNYGELRSLLLAYYYQNWIAGATVARIKQTSFNILKLINKKESIDAVKSEMKKNLDEYSTTTKFKEELSSSHVYGRKWSRAILLLIEYFSSDNSNQTFIRIGRKLHLEHILPQTPTTEWKNAFDIEDIEKWTNSLANLTLLSMKKNIQAKNHSFKDKCEIYENKNNVVTSYVITQGVIKCDKWDVPELEKRKDRLIGTVMKNLDLFD